MRYVYKLWLFALPFLLFLNCSNQGIDAAFPNDIKITQISSLVLFGFSVNKYHVEGIVRDISRIAKWPRDCSDFGLSRYATFTWANFASLDPNLKEQLIFYLIEHTSTNEFKNEEDAESFGLYVDRMLKAIPILKDLRNLSANDSVYFAGCYVEDKMLSLRTQKYFRKILILDVKNKSLYEFTHMND
jgi:hypothetical protein